MHLCQVFSLNLARIYIYATIKYNLHELPAVPIILHVIYNVLFQRDQYFYFDY